MKIKVLAFAQARDAFGFSEVEVEANETLSAFEFLESRWPGSLDKTPSSRIALDMEYVSKDTPLGGAKELAILPPVSGG